MDMLPSPEQLQEFGRRGLNPLLEELAQIVEHTDLATTLAYAAFAATHVLITVASAAGINPCDLAECVVRTIRQHQEGHP